MFFFLLIVAQILPAKTIVVGKNEAIKSIKKAIEIAQNGDVILVKSGRYKEENISIEKSISLIGEGYPILDGQRKYEILSLRANK